MSIARCGLLGFVWLGLGCAPVEPPATTLDVRPSPRQDEPGPNSGELGEAEARRANSAELGEPEARRANSTELGEPEARRTNPRSKPVESPDERADPRCAWPVVGTSLGKTTDRSLAEALESTDDVFLAQVELSRSDCSGIGWHHLVVKAVDNPSLAYVRQRLPALDSPRGRFVLVGVSSGDEREVDLGSVCIGFKKVVNAHIEWFVDVAVDDPSEWTNPSCPTDVDTR